MINPLYAAIFQLKDHTFRLMRHHLSQIQTPCVPFSSVSWCSAAKSTLSLLNSQSLTQLVSVHCGSTFSFSHTDSDSTCLCLPRVDTLSLAPSDSDSTCLRLPLVNTLSCTQTLTQLVSVSHELTLLHPQTLTQPVSVSHESTLSLAPSDSDSTCLSPTSRHTLSCTHRL